MVTSTNFEDEGYLTSLSDDAIVMWDDLYRLIKKMRSI